jgi:Xaa-Pro aminopeptidase
MFARRLEAVRQRISESRLQGLVITSLPNIRYLTGFTGSHAILFLSKERAQFFTDSRYRNQAPAEVREARVIITSGTLLEKFSRIISFSPNESIGFEASSLTVAMFNNLKRIVERGKLVPTIDLIERIRAFKDEDEISKIKRAVEITDRVFNKILAILKPGMREIDIAAEITYWHKRLGADSDAFDVIVASGVRGAYPHARASTNKIQKGEMVTIDMGCCVEGYHSDLTRTVTVGKPRPELKKIYAVVLEALRKSIGRVRVGIPASSLDAIARKSIREKGYGKYFNHALGHGLGLEVHELPRVSSRSKENLTEGSVIAIEPGIYVPTLGGVRIEDDIVVREGGIEVLSGASRELVIV